MTTFQQRALTATVFTAVMLLGMFLHQATFILLFFIISMGCLWEYMKLTTDGNKVRKGLTLALGAGFWLFFLASTSKTTQIEFWQSNIAFGLSSDKNFYPVLVLFGLYLVISPFLLLIFELFEGSDKPFQNVSGVLFAIFYTVFPFFLLIHLSDQTQDSLSYITFLPHQFTPNIAAGILFLTWINDSGAYIVGSKIGKTPLFPRISPKKTWEGTIGGVVFCILSGFLIHQLLGVLSLKDWLVIGVIVSVFGTLGDLVESMLKRSVGVKDSGTFMPGHGGFLDRFDAFIFELPFVFLYLIIK